MTWKSSMSLVPSFKWEVRDATLWLWQVKFKLGLAWSMPICTAKSWEPCSFCPSVLTFQSLSQHVNEWDHFIMCWRTYKVDICSHRMTPLALTTIILIMEYPWHVHRFRELSKGSQYCTARETMLLMVGRLFCSRHYTYICMTFPNPCARIMDTSFILGK